LLGDFDHAAQVAIAKLMQFFDVCKTSLNDLFMYAVDSFALFGVGGVPSFGLAFLPHMTENRSGRQF